MIHMYIGTREKRNWILLGTVECFQYRLWLYHYKYFGRRHKLDIMMAKEKTTNFAVFFPNPKFLVLDSLWRICCSQLYSCSPSSHWPPQDLAPKMGKKFWSKGTESSVSSGRQYQPVKNSEDFFFSFHVSDCDFPKRGLCQHRLQKWNLLHG